MGQWPEEEEEEEVHGLACVLVLRWGVGVDWKHSHGNRRRHGPHLKLIQSGRDTQT